MTIPLTLQPGAVVKLRNGKNVPEQVHVFAKREIQAINTALAAGRPLLLRGEPGVGKSQLAHAAAKALGWAFVFRTVDANTEAHDLLWHFDAVARLAEAQVQGAVLGAAQDANGKSGEGISCRETAIRKTISDNLALNRFVHPRALWWALNWENAAAQAAIAKAPEPLQEPECKWSNGVVALIDEIDKGGSDVPNGLLEVLGAQSFEPFGLPDRMYSDGRPTLIVITTNEERRLPDAFVRRCLVLKMQLPEERGELVVHLMERAKAHFRGAKKELLQRAAEMLADDREQARKENLYPLPGQAEYLDLLRAVRTLAPKSAPGQMAMLEDLRDFALKKGMS